MARTFDFTVWGDGLGEWLTAAALAMAGRPTALVLTRALDREAGVFPEAPVDLSGSEVIANYFGEAPAGGPEDRFEADFQVIWPEARLDVFADPEEFRFGLERDIPAHAQAVLAASTGLRKLAEKIEREILARPDYPPLTWTEKLVLRLKGLGRGFPELGRSLGEFLKELAVPKSRQWIFLLPLKALCPGLGENPSLGSAALLWNFLCRQKRSEGMTADLRLRLRDLIQRNGAVFDSRPERVALEKRILLSIHLADRVELQTGLLIAEPAALFSVLDPGQREDRVGRQLALLFARSVQHTLYFRVERSALPEVMAQRTLVLHDPSQPLHGTNFMVLCRIPRVPKWETLAVTVSYPKGDVPPPLPEEVVKTLHWLLPFLGREQVELDENRPVVSRYHYALPKSNGFWPRSCRTPLKNVYLPPDQVLPGLGPWANFLVAGALSQRQTKRSA